MKKITFLIITTVFFLLSSCIPSLHSIVDEENRVVDDRLVGDYLEGNQVQVVNQKVPVSNTFRTALMQRL